MKEFDEIQFFHYSFRMTDSIGELKAHKLPYLDLTYCIEGEMHYNYEGEEYILEGGDAILYPAGSVRIRHCSTTPTLYASFNVGFSNSFVPKICGVLRKSVRSDTVQILESVKKSHNSVFEERKEKCASLFYYLYYQLIETATDNENPHIKHIKKYVAAHLREKLTLREIADAVHLAPHYCCALFSKYEGVSIFDFIKSKRIEIAKNLITANAMPLSEVAEHSGFTDYNYFSRTFKRVCGVSASEYAKSVKQ